MKRGNFMNFRYKLMQFMSGRYGVDQLFYLLFGVSAVLSLINCFIPWLIVKVIVQLLIYAIMGFAFYRVLSRNVWARARENQLLTKFITQIKKQKSIRRQRKADYTHIYKKCPRCHAVLRLPRRKGKHTTVCPKCSKEFKVHVFKA